MKVLVADDELVSRKKMERLLQDLGYETRVASPDVYDALVSNCPYKEPFTHDRARNIIVEGRGSHFDPMVVDAFLTCEERFIEIHERYRSD